MDVKFNVAAILKYKPKGTKLYDYLHNIDVEFNDVETTEIETSIWCTREKGGYNELFGYSKLGTLRGWLDGLQILLPSKEMRDWRKFVWKKGDVLISNDGKKEVFFNGFTDDTYALFKAKHGFEILSEGNTIYLADEDGIATSDYTLETEEAAKTYINTIEERLCGKLNMETLEIEHAHQEFKDGDILLYKSARFTYFSSIFILKTNRNEMSSYVRFSIGKGSIDYDVPVCNLYTDMFRYATEEEKQQLFSALAKENKAWDSEKKEFVDLKPKVELKPFDKVLVRNDKEDQWSANIFSYQVRDNMYYCLGECYWRYCIPYEGNEHLLGTTNNVED